MGWLSNRQSNKQGLAPRIVKKCGQTYSKSLASGTMREDASGTLQVVDIFAPVWALSQQNETLRNTMEELKIDRVKLEELFGEIMSIGTGQFRGGHFVAVSSLLYPETLKYCCSVLNSESVTEDAKRELGGNLLKNFDPSLGEMTFVHTQRFSN